MNEPTLDILRQRINWTKSKVWRWVISVAICWVVVFVGDWILFAATPALVSSLTATCFTSGKNNSSLICPSLGLELWEEGKRSERIFQQWNLNCFREQPRAVSCTLVRTLIVIYKGNFEWSSVTEHRHSTTDGTLRVLDTNWNEGRLEFEVIFVGGKRMPVLMKLKPMAPGESGLLNVESFQAKDVVRTVFSRSLVAQEWRIPEYTYNVKLEMVIAGKKSTNQKVLDGLVKRLTPKDRVIFESSKGRCIEVGFSEKYLSRLMKGPGMSEYEARSREIETKIKQAKDAGERLDLYAQQSALAEKMANEIYSRIDVRNAIKDRFDNCLAKTGMSADGRTAVTEFLIDRVLTGLSR